MLVPLEGEIVKAKAVDERLVLVVDDDSGNRESMSELLDNKGYSVLQAENGQKALDMLKQAPILPCLVVLDMAMPIMDGRGFLKRRAHDPDLRDIPVVLVSGNSQKGALKGIEGYFRKPVNVERLIEVIDQHC
jgi:two-component system, chemotaxis family, chemotaxis protein CheY